MTSRRLHHQRPVRHRVLLRRRLWYQRDFLHLQPQRLPHPHEVRHRHLLHHMQLYLRHWPRRVGLHLLCGPANLEAVSISRYIPHRLGYQQVLALSCALRMCHSCPAAVPGPATAAAVAQAPRPSRCGLGLVQGVRPAPLLLRGLLGVCVCGLASSAGLFLVFSPFDGHGHRCMRRR